MRTDEPSPAVPAQRARLVPSPSVAVLFAGLLALAAFFLVRPAFDAGPYYRPRPSGTTYAYWYLVAAAFVPYALALRAARRGAAPSAGLLLAGAVVVYAALVPAPAQQSQDLYQYLLYGRMAAHGVNPYVVYATSIQDPWRAFTLWDDTLSVYGPVWTYLCAALARISGGNLTVAFLVLKALAVGLTLGAAAALAAATRSPSPSGPGGGLRADRSFVVLAFAYNPMVVVAAGLGAHAETAVAACIGGAVLSERRGRPALTTALLSLATLVKPYVALVLLAWLVCLWRRRGLGRAAAHTAGAALLAVAAYAPLWEGARTFSGLWDVTRDTSASLAGSIIRVLTGNAAYAFGSGVGAIGTGVRALGLLVIALSVVLIARSERTEGEPWRAAAILFAVYVLVTPWYLYWHLMGLVALAAIVADEAITRGVLTFSGTSLAVLSGGRSLGLVAQTVVRYAPPLAVAWTGRAASPERRVPR